MAALGSAQVLGIDNIRPQSRIQRKEAIMNHVRTFPREINTFTKASHQLIVLLAACTALLMPAVTANAQSGDAVNVVTMNDAMRFVPASITVHSGDQVE